MMQLLFDKMKDYRGMALTWLALAGTWFDGARDVLNMVVTLFVENPISDEASFGAFLAAVAVTAKTIIAKVRDKLYPKAE